METIEKCSSLPWSPWLDQLALSNLGPPAEDCSTHYSPSYINRQSRCPTDVPAYHSTVGTSSTDVPLFPRDSDLCQVDLKKKTNYKICFYTFGKRPSLLWLEQRGKRRELLHHSCPCLWEPRLISLEIQKSIHQPGHNNSCICVY